MFWRNGTRLTGGSRRFMFGAVSATVVVGAAVLTGVAWAGGPARGASGPPASGAGTAVEYSVSAAQQRATLAYWTPARMAAVEQAAVISQTPGVQNGKAPKGTPTASQWLGVPTVGALFSVSDTTHKNHYCTASVVDSPVGDIILTAAHCIYSKKDGFGANIEYIPEWHENPQGKVVTPYGEWVVQHIWVMSGWVASQDPNVDFAFMSVATPPHGRNIQAVTGGLRAGFLRGYDQHIEVIGYNDGEHEPVRCETTSFKFHTDQMEFYCHDYWSGTSGGPWIFFYNPKTGGGTVFGVIGGWQTGGTEEWASYSAYFGVDARSLLEVAEREASPTP